jgi:hypothetical protein
LKLIEAVLQATTKFARTRHAADEVARGLIAAERSALMQRLIRAALRSGTVSAPALRREGMPLPSRGMLGDAAVGLARRLQRRTTPSPIMPPAPPLPVSH